MRFILGNVNVRKRRTLKKRVRRAIAKGRSYRKHDTGCHDRWSWEASCLLHNTPEEWDRAMAADVD